jgi:hypothetical protein
MEKESFYANDDAEVDDENYDTNSILPDSLSSSSAIAEAIVQVDQSKNLDFNSNTNNFVNDLQQDFQVLMSNRKNETNDFRLMIITLGLSLISIGILANLVFNLLVMLRKKKRQTCTTLIMFSMCFSYLIYLAFYSLKLSIYFNGDNITKYHIYDTIDNWTYGSFLCKFLSALPIAVKLISRLSILTIAFKRVVTLLICSSTSVSSSSSSVDCDYFNEEEIKFKEFFIKNSVKLKSSSKINENTFESSLNDADESSNHNIDSVTIQPNRKKFNKFNTIRKIFEWPIIFVIVALIWAISFFSSWPIYSMYKLNRPTGSTSENIEVFTSNTICDSVYSFPEDTKKVASIYLNYLIYALILPCSFILIFLLILYVLDSNFCNIVSDSSKSRHSNIKNSSGGVIVTTRGISSGSSTDSTSFDEVNSSSLTSGSNSGCYKIRSGKHNNLLLWLMFIIHLLSSLPQELYRYLQLKVDFDDENILDQYLTLILMQPLVKARPYYAMQLIYTSEFAIMPLLFLLFYLCSNSFCCSNKRRTESNELDVNIIKKISLCGRLRDIFYDIELSRPLSHHISESQKSLSRRLLNTSSNSSNSRKITHYPRQLHHHNKKRINTNTISNPLMNNNNSKIAFNKIQLSSHDDIQTSLNEALLAIKNHNLNIENKNASNNSNNCSVISNKLNFSQRKLSSSLKPTPFELANQSNNEQFSLNPTNNNSTKSNILHIIQHPSWRCNIKQQSVNNNNNKNNNTFSDENESSDSFQLPFNYAKTTSYNT